MRGYGLHHLVIYHMSAFIQSMGMIVQLRVICECTSSCSPSSVYLSHGSIMSRSNIMFHSSTQLTGIPLSLTSTRVTCLAHSQHLSPCALIMHTMSRHCMVCYLLHQGCFSLTQIYTKMTCAPTV